MEFGFCVDGREVDCICEELSERVVFAKNHVDVNLLLMTLICLTDAISFSPYSYRKCIIIEIIRAGRS